jgi:hypothetical protein
MTTINPNRLTPVTTTTNSDSGSGSNISSSTTISSQLLQQTTSLNALGSYGNASSQDTNSWYEAMARAWGQALDKQAQVITDMSDSVANAGNDQPSQITQLTAESERFSFLSTNASTATTSVGQALDSLGRKQ